MNSEQVHANSNFMPEYFVDADEAAKFLILDPRTVQNKARLGVIPAHPLGDGPRKTWRFLLSELSAWMQNRSKIN